MIRWGVSRHPDLAAAARVLPQSMFARLYERLARFEGDVIPLQIGDTHLPPPEPARLGALGFSLEHEPALYSYAGPHGDRELLDALVEKLHRKNQLGFVTRQHVQVTCGATHGLSCGVRTVLDPGDEILVLSPHWPLIRNVVMSHGANPVDVPFSQRLLRSVASEDRSAQVAALLAGYVGPETTAIYLCTPNNPDGMVMDREVLEGVARVARAHDLWVIADEVYEYFTYDDHRHTSIASLPGMDERTITVFSFSKSHGLAGLRLGYAAGPATVMESMRRMVNTSVYSVSQAMQRVALRALTHGEGFVREARERYRDARDHALARVQAPCQVPQGSTYLWLDFSAWIDHQPGASFRSAMCLLERMADAGLLLAPGFGFGLDYADWARLCFIAVPRERLDEGIARLNRVLERPSRG